MNARIRELAPGVIAERIATSLHCDYSPVTRAASITISAPEFVTIDGELQPFTSPPIASRWDVAAIATRRFGIGEVDPVTGAPLDGVTVAGVDLLIKRAIDVLLNEQAAAMTSEG